MEYQYVTISLLRTKGSIFANFGNEYGEEQEDYQRRKGTYYGRNSTFLHDACDVLLIPADKDLGR